MDNFELGWIKTNTDEELKNKKLLSNELELAKLLSECALENKPAFKNDQKRRTKLLIKKIEKFITGKEQMDPVYIEFPHPYARIKLAPNVLYSITFSCT